MRVTATSILTGKCHTMDLPITEAQVTAFNAGVLAQDAFPELSAAEREFLISGITPEEWAEAFPPEED